MKALILYASKHGAVREIANQIAKKLDGAAVCDLKQSNIPPLSQFDCVIIGSSLYAGQIRKEAKTFLTQNADKLKEKRLALFLSGMDSDADRVKTYFETNFPSELLQSAASKSFLGGIFDPEKTGMFERLIMKAVAKQSVYSNTITDEKIERFAEAMRESCESQPIR